MTALGSRILPFHPSCVTNIFTTCRVFGIHSTGRSFGSFFFLVCCPKLSICTWNNLHGTCLHLFSPCCYTVASTCAVLFLVRPFLLGLLARQSSIGYLDAREDPRRHVDELQRRYQQLANSKRRTLWRNYSRTINQGEYMLTTSFLLASVVYDASQ